jgi:hypothetical protein
MRRLRAYADVSEEYKEGNAAHDCNYLYFKHIKKLSVKLIPEKDAGAPQHQKVLTVLARSCNSQAPLPQSSQECQ